MQFLDKDSYVALDGRHIYHGKDAEEARIYALTKWSMQGGTCARCGLRIYPGAEDWEHIKSKGRNLRDDHPRNRRFVHGMFSKEGCHRKAHNREPRWSPRPAA